MKVIVLNEDDFWPSDRNQQLFDDTGTVEWSGYRMHRIVIVTVTKHRFALHVQLKCTFNSKKISLKYTSQNTEFIQWFPISRFYQVLIWGISSPIVHLNTVKFSWWTRTCIAGSCCKTKL